jgi:UDP-N-acetylglucosamine 2-epimerase
MKRLKILSVVGARPQFIKLAPLSRVIRSRHQEFLLHTGQHYDPGMSRVFFDELEIPEPDSNLGVGSDSHAVQTGEMLIGIEKILLQQKPDVVVVYGDTNSTLAGALAAVKLNIPVAHVEAGLRSFNWAMPEEINRILTDRISTFLFAPTPTAVENLRREGLEDRTFLVGDVMVDALRHFIRLARKKTDPLRKFRLREKEYLLVTVHRASNADERENLSAILRALVESGETVLFPVHPRTRRRMQEFGLEKVVEGSKVLLVEPVSYLEMLLLEASARKILTDSGGMQKEAYILGVPCITLREETEWVETVEEGWNLLTGPSFERILEAIRDFHPAGEREFSYGDGHASEKIVRILEERLRA